MSELDQLLLDLLDGQTFVLKSYKQLIEHVEDDELRQAFIENFKHMAMNHKEIIFHLGEKLDESPDSDSEDEDDEEDDEDVEE